jgi:LPXTG-motif cell wall-anchored protein
MRSALVAVAAGIALFPAGTALAQDLPDVPGIGAAQDQIDRAPRTPRRPGSSLPGSGALPVDTSARAARGSGAPTRLPETGVDTTALALDGLTLLGAGTLLLTIRRRLASHS